MDRGLGRVGRLAEHGAVQHDHGVDAEHGRLAAVDRASLPDRVLDGIVADLLVRGRDIANGIRSCSRIARRCGEVEASTIIRRTSSLMGA